MTVREDLEARIKKAEFQKLELFAFYLVGAMEKMSEDELNKEIEDDE